LKKGTVDKNLSCQRSACPDGRGLPELLAAPANDFREIALLLQDFGALRDCLLN
jgi:hypothetical protein